MIFSHFSERAVRNFFVECAKEGEIDLSSNCLEAFLSPQVTEAMERALRSPETFRDFSTMPLKERLGGQALPVAGIKNGLRLAMAAWLNPGDEVLMFSPAPSYHGALADLLGAVPRFIKLDEEEGFFPDKEALKAQISPRTRAILLSNPQYPTGVLWDQEAFEGLISLARERGLLVFSDEEGSAFVYEGQFVSPFRLAPDCVVSIENIVPALSGWEAAAVRGPAEFLQRVELLGGLGGGFIPSTQAFVLNEAWEHRTPERISEELKERRDLLLGLLDKQHGLRTLRPQAGIHCFSSVRYYLGNEVGGEVPTSSESFAEIIARKVQVRVAPSSIYGLEGFFRCSFVQRVDILAEAVRRMASIFEQGK